MQIPNYTLIGVGHRARQGKDTTANFISTHRKNVHVLHFADALYDEVRNLDRKYPLIKYAGMLDGVDGAKRPGGDYYALTWGH